jgi:hypothetical protein
VPTAAFSDGVMKRLELLDLHWRVGRGDIDAVSCRLCLREANDLHARLCRLIKVSENPFPILL